MRPMQSGQGGPLAYPATAGLLQVAQLGEQVFRDPSRSFGRRMHDIVEVARGVEFDLAG